MQAKCPDLPYPPFIDEIAERIGVERMEVNKEARENNLEYDRGEDQNKKNDINGVWGEMAGQYIVAQLGYEIKETVPLTMIKGKPKPGADIVTIKGDRIDCKCVSSITHTCTVNVKNHSKCKGKVNTYLFIERMSGYRLKYYTYKYDEVSLWSIADGMNSSRYHFLRMPI